MYIHIYRCACVCVWCMYACADIKQMRPHLYFNTPALLALGTKKASFYPRPRQGSNRNSTQWLLKHSIYFLAPACHGYPRSDIQLGSCFLWWQVDDLMKYMLYNMFILGASPANNAYLSVCLHLSQDVATSQSRTQMDDQVYGIWISRVHKALELHVKDYHCVCDCKDRRV